MIKRMFLIIFAAALLAGCQDNDPNEEDPNGLSPNVEGYFEGFVYLPTVGFKAGVLNRKDHTARFYRDNATNLADTSSVNKVEGTWRLEDNHYTLTVEYNGDTMYFEAKDVKVPTEKIEGTLRFKTSKDTGEYMWGRKQQ